MIIISVTPSKAGAEFIIECENNEKYTITLADAKRLGFYNLSDEDFPIEFEDGDTLEFLHKKLRAIKYCTYLLEFSDKSESVLRRKLLEKQYDKDVIDEALRVLRESGVTNDECLALRKYISLATVKLYGPLRINNELIQKGFSQSCIKEVKEKADIDFEELLCQLIEKLLSSSKVDFSDRNATSKFKAKLSRYGYGFETINRVLVKYSSEDYDY